VFDPFWHTQVDDFVEAALAKFLKTGLELLKLG
jgi:hypothetical protein